MQTDLFDFPTVVPSSVKTTESNPRDVFLDRYRFSFRFDQLMVGVIIQIILFVLIFSFGAESGKRFAMGEIKAERGKRERVEAELRDKLKENMFQTSQLAVQLPQAKQNVPVDAKILPSPGKIDEKAERLKEKLSPYLKKTEPDAGKFAIQVVTYKTQSAADRKLKTLFAKGFKGFIVSKGDYQLVCVNGFGNRQEAKKILDRMKSQGLAPSDAYVRPVPQ